MPLLALRVIESPREHADVFAMGAFLMVANALMFQVPLDTQGVQGKTKS
jgi:hypothetical protein